MAGDHGVCEEGVSAYPAEVTPEMVLNFVNGGAAINVLGAHAGARVIVTDVGVAYDFDKSIPILSQEDRQGHEESGEGTGDEPRGSEAKPGSGDRGV